jgi:hypothetical protein
VPNTALLNASVSSLVFDGDLKQTFSVHNAGNADVHVASIGVTGPNAASFHVKIPVNFVVHKNANHTVEVDLAGGLNSHVAAHASLTVHSNAPDVHVSLTKLAQKVPHGPGPNPGQGETPSTGPNQDDPSGTGWGVPGGGGGCFAAGTHVLMADGTPRRIEDVAVGDAILAIAERDHAQQSAPAAGTARIERVLRHDGGHPLLDVDGILATPVHRWAVRDGGDAAGFLRTDQLVAGATSLRVYDGVAAAWRPAGEAVPSGSAETVYNFTTSDRTYLVGACPDGPWYVVHNDKNAKTDDKPDDNNP